MFSGGWGPVILWYLVNAIYFVVIPIGVIMVIRRLLHTFERRAVAPREVDGLQAQIEELQDQVAAIARDNARLREASSSTTDLRDGQDTYSRPA